MTAPLVGVIAALVSSTGLAILVATDPKRRLDVQFRSRWLRISALSVSLLPGLALVGMGRGVGFLIWIAGTALLGWALVGLANRQVMVRPRTPAC